MTLGGLLHAFADRSGVPVPSLDAAAQTPVSSISYDSRKARAGSVFVALRGMQADGTAFARQAISRGAVAALSESAAPADVEVVWVQVPDARLALAALAAIFYGDPSEELVLVGITGTNGKTTTS
jgi:UDP-N-acetylmuramoyl-L-alanyl-D-glutamate--2,6-diaminopimelate ligase